MSLLGDGFVVVESEPPPSLRLLRRTGRPSEIDVLNVPLTSNESVSTAPPPNNNHLFVVAVCILFLLVNSSGQNYYVRYAESRNAAPGNGVYLLCWFSSIFQVFVYPLHMLAACAYRRIQTCCARGAADVSGPQSVNVLAERFREPKHFLLNCFGLTILNFFGTYTWYLSLGMLPVSFNFVVSKSSVVFSYLLSVPILNEAIDVSKALMMLTIIVGIVCVAIGKNSSTDSSNSVDGPPDNFSLGLAVTLLQASLSSLYNCFFKRSNPFPRPADVSLILTFQGAFSLLLFWPPLLFLQDCNPSIVLRDSSQAAFLCINALLAVLYYLIYAVGIIFSTASHMSISGTLTVPTSTIIDAVFLHLSFPPIYIFGCVIVPVAVLAAFLYRARVKPWPPKFAWLSYVILGTKLSK